MGKDFSNNSTNCTLLNHIEHSPNKVSRPPVFNPVVWLLDEIPKDFDPVVWLYELLYPDWLELEPDVECPLEGEYDELYDDDPRDDEPREDEPLDDELREDPDLPAFTSSINEMCVCEIYI